MTYDPHADGADVLASVVGYWNGSKFVSSWADAALFRACSGEAEDAAAKLKRKGHAVAVVYLQPECFHLARKSTTE